MRTRKGFMPGIVLAFVAAFTISVNATSVRDMGMGLYENPWFVDGLQTYIYQNPAYLKDYNNISFFERTGALDGQNMGAIFYSLSPSMNVGVHIGRPVDQKVWNSTGAESLFHKGNYSIKGTPFTASNAYLPAGATAYDGYQFGMVDGSIIDLMDPSQGSRYFDGTSTSKSDNRNELLQRNASLMFSWKSGAFAMGVDVGYATSWDNKRNSNSGTGEREEYVFINTEYDALLGFIYAIDASQSIDGSIGWTMYSLKSSYDKVLTGGYTANMTYDSDMAMDINALVRYNMLLSKTHKMHIRAAYSFLNRSAVGTMKVVDENGIDPDNSISGNDDFVRTGQRIKFGVSDEMSFTHIKAFAGFDIEFGMFKNDYSGVDTDTMANSADKYTNNLSSIRIPVVLGMEANHNDNWTSRYGIVQKIYQPITNSGENITNFGGTTNPTDYNGNSSSATDLFAGLTYKRDNFKFDWLVNMNLFVAGPYFVSGKTATGGSVPLAFSTAIAATYSFDLIVSGKSADTQVKPVEVVKPAEDTKQADAAGKNVKGAKAADKGKAAETVKTADATTPPVTAVKTAPKTIPKINEKETEKK